MVYRQRPFRVLFKFKKLTQDTSLVTRGQNRFFGVLPFIYIRMLILRMSKKIAAICLKLVYHQDDRGRNIVLAVEGFYPSPCSGGFAFL